MKINFKNRNSIAALILIVGLSISLYACKKDNTGIASSTTVTEADAAELTTDAIVPSTGGLTTQLSSSVTVYATVTIPCGVSKDSTISRSSVNGITPAYNYNLQWGYLLNCSTGSFTGSFTGSTTYDGLRMSSNDSSTGNVLITGVLPGASSYTISTSYSRNGSSTSKIGNKNFFTSKLAINSSNIVIDKTTLVILSGSASVTATGASTSGKSFTFSGIITFLGGNKATLVLNSGITYNIAW
jgi:hypothetical protein